MEQTKDDRRRTLQVDSKLSVSPPTSSDVATLAATEAPQAFDPLADPVLADLFRSMDPYSDVLISVGTDMDLHQRSLCKPCFFVVAESGCVEGKKCQCCHLLHGKHPRQKKHQVGAPSLRAACRDFTGSPGIR